MTVFNINLIAARRRQKQHAAAVTRLGVYSIIGLIVVVVLVYSVMDMQVRQVQASIDQVNSELTDPALADSIKRIQFLERQTALLQPRVQVLEKVHSSEQDWIQIINDIGSCAPHAKLWLTQMNTERSDKNQAISLRGKAFRQEDIGAFMLSLTQPSWSGDPALGFTQSQRDPSGIEVVDFEVTVPLKMTVGGDLK